MTLSGGTLLDAGPDSAARASSAVPRALLRGQAVRGTPHLVARFLGQGGMGEVYEVEHRALGRRCVLKVLHRNHAGRYDLAARMRSEARVLAGLRHPNLVALELSSFKCGHDAPIYTVVEEIVEHSGTPYFCFKDIDENKPTGSIKIRVETIGYFLKRYREDMVANKKKEQSIEQQLKEFESRLRKQLLRERLESDQKVRDTYE